MEKTNIFMYKPPEVHFTITHRVPYNKLLTSARAALGNIAPRSWQYGPSAARPRANIPQYGPPARLVTGYYYIVNQAPAKPALN